LETVETLPASLGSSTRPEGDVKRIHAEHHSSFASATLRTAFALDIPSDGSPAFQVDLPAFAPPSSSSAVSSPEMGGLEWRVRLCLLVSVTRRRATNSSSNGVGGDDDDDQGLKYLVRDGPRGEWGTSFRAANTLAPSAKSGYASSGVPTQSRSWISFFSGAIATLQNGDDDDEDDGVGGDDDVGGGEDGWKPLDVETVECEVPIKVWPGNTAYRAVDAVFDL
jgi:RAB6A-GEF complex partner protein 2